MKKSYLMQSSSMIQRNKSYRSISTRISKDWKLELIKLAIHKAMLFYSSFFGQDAIKPKDLDQLAMEYLKDLGQARDLELLKKGGIREKDHINFWCLSNAFSPELYIESGVFIGSSLHAFSKSPGVKEMIAIDPDMSNLRIPMELLPNTKFIENKDFSQLIIPNMPKKSLAYFDDHINTAKRVIEARNKGIRYLLFDDSTGLEGICQRLYPPFPTVPMILHREILKVGSVLEWSWKSPLPASGSFVSRLEYFAKRILGRGQYNLTIEIDQKTIDQCREAFNSIKRCEKIPDLGVYIPQDYPERSVNTSKYIMELNI